MFCQLYKWQIARSMDHNQSLPGFVAGHISKCSSCREYSSFSAYLQAQGAEQALKLPQPMAGQLSKNIITSLKTKNPLPRPVSRRLPMALAYISLSLAVLLTGLVILLNQNSSSENKFFFNQLNPKPLATTRGVISLVAGAENRLEQEYQEIKKTLALAKNFFITALDIKFLTKDNKSEQMPAARNIN